MAIKLIRSCDILTKKLDLHIGLKADLRIVAFYSPKSDKIIIDIRLLSTIFLKLIYSLKVGTVHDFNFVMPIQMEN